MENPTFNRKQQKTTLSAKKKKLKSAPTKHVLATPYTRNPIPQVSSEDLKTLLSELDRNLPRIKEDRIRIPYKQIKNVPVEKRREFRENYYKYRGIVVNKSDSKGLVIGVNNVTKVLETNSAAVVLIADDVKPKLLTDHIFNLAASRRIPVLEVSELRRVLKERCGFSGTCMTLKNDIDIGSKLYVLLQTVLGISKNYAMPESNLNDNLESSCIIIEEEMESSSKKPQTIIDHKAIRSKIYLKRTNETERVFKPKCEETMIVDTPEDVPTTVNKMDATRLTPKSKYRPLKVKVLRGDPNRNKRKIDQLKLSKSDKRKKKKFKPQ